MVSSSRKPAWILPKGGWESDERCEDGALRETYEEGGILGTLGPRLGDVEHRRKGGGGGGGEGESRMCMYPLYVLEVRENWPESGRARKVVDIDTAIEIFEGRPEFQRVLREVKEKGYHLVPSEGDNGGIR